MALALGRPNWSIMRNPVIGWTIPKAVMPSAVTTK
jgi:hypothetical protein